MPMISSSSTSSNKLLRKISTCVVISCAVFVMCWVVVSDGFGGLIIPVVAWWTVWLGVVSYVEEIPRIEQAERDTKRYLGGGR